MKMDDEEGKFCVFLAFSVIVAYPAPVFLIYQCKSWCVGRSCYLVLGIESYVS